MTCLKMRTLASAVVVAMSVAFAGCSDSPQSASDNEAALLHVSPRGGSTNVDPNAHVRLEFHHAIQDGMEQFCAVHLGGVDGEKVAGSWTWSEEHHVLTFTPHEPFRHDANHTVHVGGGIIDVHGHHLDFDQHGHEMGGHWVDEDMLGHGGHGHRDEHWKHHNGSYGMAFPFRTAAAPAQKVALLHVSPQGGSTNVDPFTHIEIEFEHRMADGVEELCALHLGRLDGEEVPGDWEWSHEHHVLTFIPHEPLHHDSKHTIHIGGGITDEYGHHMDFDQHGHALGGQWVEEHVLGDHGGRMGHHSHMGEGWQPHDGHYGMLFSFWTAP